MTDPRQDQVIMLARASAVQFVEHIEGLNAIEVVGIAMLQWETDRTRIGDVLYEQVAYLRQLYITQFAIDIAVAYTAKMLGYMLDGAAALLKKEAE